jgi:hypothetical protein
VAANGRATHPRIEASEFKTPTLDDYEGGELSVGIGVWLRWAGRFELCRALALAEAALPNEVGGVVLATADLALLLDDDSSQIMIIQRTGEHTHKAIKRYYLRVGFITRSAFQLQRPSVKGRMHEQRQKH